MMNNQQSMPLEEENEMLKKMVFNLRNDIANAVMAASEYKARYEMAEEKLKQQERQRPVKAAN